MRFNSLIGFRALLRYFGGKLNTFAADKKGDHTTLFLHFMYQGTGMSTIRINFDLRLDVKVILFATLHSLNDIYKVFLSIVGYANHPAIGSPSHRILHSEGHYLPLSPTIAINHAAHGSRQRLNQSVPAWQARRSPV